MGAVLFTLLVQGLSIEALVKKLGLDVPEFPDLLAEKEGALRAKEGSLASVGRLEKGGFFSERVATRLRSEAEQTIAQAKAEIDVLTSKMSDDESSRILSMRTLSREKTRYEELFRRGLIGEWAYRELSHNVDQQLDDAKHYGRMPGAAYRHTPLHNASVRALQLIAEFPLLGPWVEQRQRMQMMRDYDVSWARYRASNSVMKSLDEIAAENGVGGSSVEQVRSAYNLVNAMMHEEISQIGASYPEFVEAAQEKLGNRLLIISEQEAVARADEMGILPHGVAEAILKQQQQRLRDIRRTNISSYLEVSAAELLTKVPMFSGLEEAQFASVIPYLHKRSFPKGEKVIRQGGSGDSLFMIGRGLVSVQAGKNGDAVEISRLYAGDFFGEAALLHGTPRNATVVAITPCSLYELHRDDLRRLCRQRPEIAAAVEAVDRERAMENIT